MAPLAHLRRHLLWPLALTASGPDLAAQTTADSDWPDLATLARIEVTTASRRATLLEYTPAAVYVLTGDEVLCSGAVTLPQVLRFVPGLDVAQVNSISWGIGARGFGGQAANQLLVMIDGRSIYEATYGNVFWQHHDVFTEDLARIEIVRGPGGALWGANAVNGVINILTKDSADTLGSVLYTGLGDAFALQAGARHGFRWGEHTTGRVYLKHTEGPDIIDLPGLQDWSRTQGGWRFDHRLGEANHLTVQGDFCRAFYDNIVVRADLSPPAYGETILLDTHYTGANVLSRLTCTLGNDSLLTLQAYWDHMEHGSTGQDNRRDTLDLDLQHDLHLGERHALTYGLGVRTIADRKGDWIIGEILGAALKRDHVFNLYAQDELTLVPERWYLTLGAKLEHNSYSAWDFQPNLRLRWQPTANQTVWASLSHTVTTPNRYIASSYFYAQALPPGALVKVSQNVDQTEKLDSLELGYRLRPTSRTSVDLATFLNRYTDLQAFVTGTLDLTGATPILPIYLRNGPACTTYGAELTLGWEPLAHRNWQLQATYSYFHSDLVLPSSGRAAGDGSPRHKATLRSTIALHRHWDWELSLRYVDRLRSLDIPGYLECDSRLAWHPSARWEFALVGQNLLHAQHLEHSPARVLPSTPIARSCYGKVTWRY